MGMFFIDGIICEWGRRDINARVCYSYVLMSSVEDVGEINFEFRGFKFF